MKFLAGIILGILLIFALASVPRLFHRPADDAAAIQTLVNRYYAALRSGKYSEAAAMYEPGSFDGIQIDPADALKQAWEFSPVDSGKIQLVNLDIQEKKAKGDVMISREGLGPVKIAMVDQNGTKVGTYARTLQFSKIKGQWRISAKDENEALGQAALKMLEDISKNQKSSQ